MRTHAPQTASALTVAPLRRPKPREVAVAVHDIEYALDDHRVPAVSED